MSMFVEACRPRVSPRTRVLERAGNAPDPEQQVRRISADVTASDDIGDGEPATGLQDAKGLAEHPVLVSGRLITQFEMMTSTELSGSGMLLDFALQELDVLDAGFALVLVASASISSVMSSP